MPVGRRRPGSQPPNSAARWTASLRPMDRRRPSGSSSSSSRRRASASGTVSLRSRSTRRASAGCSSSAWRFAIGARSRGRGARRAARRAALAPAVGPAAGAGVAVAPRRLVHGQRRDVLRRPRDGPASLAGVLVYIYPAIVAVLSLRYRTPAGGPSAVDRARASRWSASSLALGGIDLDTPPPVAGLAAHPRLAADLRGLDRAVGAARRRAARASGPTSGGDAADDAAAATALMITATAVRLRRCGASSPGGRSPRRRSRPRRGRTWSGSAFASTFLAIQTFYAGRGGSGPRRPRWSARSSRSDHRRARLRSCSATSSRPIQLVGAGLIIVGVLIAQTGRAAAGRAAAGPGRSTPERPESSGQRADGGERLPRAPSIDEVQVRADPDEPVAELQVARRVGRRPEEDPGGLAVRARWPRSRRAAPRRTTARRTGPGCPSSARGRSGRRTGRRRRRARRSRRRSRRRAATRPGRRRRPTRSAPRVGVGDLAQPGAARRERQRRGRPPADSAGTAASRGPRRRSRAAGP